MKKKIKSLVKAIIICLIIGIIIYSCSDRRYKIKTEYGDVFHVFCDSWGEVAFISNPEHNFDISIDYIGSKKDLTPVCDTEYFRCYRLKNVKEDLYICGLKPDGDYFWIGPDEEKAPPFFKEEYSEDFKKVFLADKYIMEVTLPYMDSIYHNEFINMAKIMVAGEFEDLDKYGLTEEMINDKESLEEKVAIMEEYLRNNTAMNYGQ